MDFGKRLKQLRTDYGITQQQLAEQLNLTKSVISYYELRERTPSPDILIKLSGIFHVTTDYLLGIEKENCLDVSDLDSEDVKILHAMIAYMRKKKKKQ